MSEAILLFGETYHHPTILWRTGFLAPDPVIYIEVDGRGTLLVDRMELGRAKKQSRVQEVANFDDERFMAEYQQAGRQEAIASAIATRLSSVGTRRARVDPDFPVAMARALEGRDIEIVCDGPLFEAERRHKTKEQQEAIRQSQAAAQSAMSAARELLRGAEVRDGLLYHQGDPLSSSTLISAIEAELLRLGCAADGTIAAGGPAAADPHLSDSGHLAAGEPVIVDIFPVHKTSRYYGDLTRTYVVGEPSPEWVRMYEAVKAAHAAALSVVGAGVNGREVHLAVCRTLFDAGYSTPTEGYRRDGVPAMLHGTGHGVGLEVHELPARVYEVDDVLGAGDVITIEPGLYSSEIGGVRLEDTVVVTEDGCRNLTDYPMDWMP